MSFKMFSPETSVPESVRFVLIISFRILRPPILTQICIMKLTGMGISEEAWLSTGLFILHMQSGPEVYHLLPR